MRSNPERAPGQLPGFEPVVVPPNGHAVTESPVEERAGSDDEVDDDDALNAILDARTPLLRRAFRNAKPDA